MKFVIIVFSLVLCPFSFVMAEEWPGLKDGDRIYQTDKYGRTMYHKESFTVQKDRLIRTDSYGRKMYHKGGYRIKSDRVYETDKYGRIMYHKPSYDLDDR